METRKIHELTIWESNPKTLSPKGYERLKDSLTLLGQFKPLLITKDNVVIGGNQRLRALKELGYEDIWVSIIEFHQDEDKWYAVINGQPQTKYFSSVKQAMTEYALADNSRAGQYDEDMLANLLSEVELDGSLDYAIDFDEPVNIEEAIEQEAKKKENYNLIVQCVGPEEQENARQKLKELGFQVK